ncbi:lipase lipl-4 isoform X1 [Daphnia magna]|uniref:lipase lipl-4 isoform X1 n=2 Tax=Daphnia magna TaxID=35525 RepID=UPI001403393D|nr:lipase lipl-4 isoform X1 [Daphnia magna]
MKDVRLVQILIISIAVYYLCPSDTLRLPTNLVNFYTNLMEGFLHSIRSRMDRNVFQDPESFMTTPEIIYHRGYPVEIHHVVTDDGYILALHRIPSGRRESYPQNGTSHLKRRPVFLQHGMMGSDHFWLVSSTNNSLAFILADLGFDVWLGNSRGNTYSRKHVSLDCDKDREFWNFSWDEMGQFDITSSIDYVLNVTREETLAAYIGYSLGCSLFFISAIERPEMNDKVDVMIGFGPTVSAAHLKNYFRLMAPFVKLYQLYQRMFGIGEVHTNDGVLHSITRLICETSEFGAEFGRYWLSHVFGKSDILNNDEYYRLIAHYPAGGSAYTMEHLLQNYNTGESLSYFDYGAEENQKRYGATLPPEYNLTSVTVSVILVHADNDPFAPPEDVSWLKTKLRNLKGSIRMGNPTFCHGDFIWSPHAAELVYLPVTHFLLSAHD